MRGARPLDPLWTRQERSTLHNFCQLGLALARGPDPTTGTRLALQLILVKRFKIYSFQLQDMDALYCYFM